MMKVLFLCLRLVFNVNDRTISRTTGYSYAVRDLMKQIASDNANIVDCICVNNEPSLKTWYDINILQRKFSNALVHIKKQYIFDGFRFSCQKNEGVTEFLRTEYYYIFGGWLENIIKKGNYDFVSIQGFTRYSMPYVIACENLGVKYGVSFHALDCFSKTYNDRDRSFITSMIKHFAEKSVPCSFISTVMKENAISCLTESEKKLARFSVILNGSSCNSSTKSARELLGISSEEKVCLCLGNINPRKNQYQLIKAYTMLDENIRKKLRIVMLGNVTDDRVKKLINEKNLQSRVILCGSVPKDEIGAYLQAADFVALLSLSEGFGLSIIEGFKFGLPSILWQDLDVTKDIYDPKCVLFVPKRTDECLAKYLLCMMEKNWNRDYIEMYSRKFSVEEMAERYMNWFVSIKER